MLNIVFVLATSFFIAYLIIPGIIHLAYKKNLYTNTKPVLENFPTRRISNMGGIAIFVALRITQSLFVKIPDFPDNYYIAGLFILFLFGLNDDLTGVRPLSRLFAQTLVAVIIVYPGQMYFHSFDGMVNFGPFSTQISQLITVLFIVGLVNAYNLIDGIDGLAGTLGVIGAFTFSFLFLQNGNIGLSLLCWTLLGALLAFLAYNLYDAKIFMGDSGAYIIGFTFAVCAIYLANQVSLAPVNINGYSITSAYGIITAITIIPVFDTLRVFILRLWNRTHPFKGDNNHIHHRLLKMGLSHLQTTLILATVTIMLILVAFNLQAISPLMQIITVFGVAFLLNLISYVACFGRIKTLSNN